MRRSLSMMLAMGLALSVFVGALAIGSAQEEQVPAGGTGAYFPWVPYGAELNDMGPFYGAVTVQNLEDDAHDLYFFAGAGEDDHAYGDPYVVANVQGNASVTVNAGSLDLDEPGAPVRVHSVETDSGIAWDSDENEFTGLPVDDDATDDIDNPVVVDAVDVFGNVAGTVKNVSPMPSQNAQTSSAHVTVDGYSGLTEEQVAFEEDTHMLPIVQTNDGWNTEIKIASFAGENDPNPSTSYTVTFYEAGGQGSAGTSSGSFTEQIRGGEAHTIDITEVAGIDEGWVGNAFITSNAPVGAVAERFKAEDEMLLSNVSRPVLTDDDGFDQSQDIAYAPLVFQQYNNWNTGISVANLDDTQSNTVTITYFTPGGSQVGSDQLTIPPRGMEFVFTAGDQDLGLGDGHIGAAVVSGTTALQAAVDQVKYLGDAEDTGDAMSYLTNHESFDQQETLALPLVQKGNPATGLGDTSGVQFFNPNPQYNTVFDVTFFDPTGNPVAPTLDEEITVNLSAHQGFTLYTHNYSEMPAGFQGSLVVDVDDGTVSAVSNNVNYETGADGAVVFNLIEVFDNDNG